MRTPPAEPRPAGAPASAAMVDDFARAVVAVGGACAVAADDAHAADLLDRIIAAPPGGTAVAGRAPRIGASDAPIVRRVLGGRLPSLGGGADLFALDVGVTGAQWGVAETGTLVLHSGAERNRLLSLVPPVHIALLDARRIRPTLAAVLAEARPTLGAALTLVTGPSRTSDIELIPVIGVHGPQQLHVIIIP